MTQTNEPTIRLRRMGIELKRIRDRLGLSVKQAGRLTTRSPGAVSRWENGLTCFYPRDLVQILDAYGVADEQLRGWILALNTDGRKTGWWQEFKPVVPSQLRDYISLEAEANRIYSFETFLIPGLLQTEDYARTVVWAGPVAESEPELETYLALRMNRQRVLTRAGPPNLHAIIGEAALRQMMGGVRVMREQLDLLGDLGDLPYVTLQVLPYAAGASSAVRGPFNLLAVEPGLMVVWSDHFFGSAYTDERGDVERATVAFERLSAAAASPEDSRALFRRLAAELREAP